MKKNLERLLGLGALAVGMALPAVSSAQQRETLSVSGQLTGSLSATSDYRFRGLSRTFGDPALQGGLEFALPSNFYVGAWASVVDKEIFANSRGYEIDMTAGYRQQLGSGIGLDVGLVQYLFPSESEFSTLEAFGGLSYRWLSLKYYYTLSNRYFGAGGARGTQYFDFTAAYPLGNGLSLVGHYGIMRGESGARDYTDWRAGVTKDWRGFVFGLSYYDTDSRFELTNRTGRTRDLGDGGLVLSVSKSF
ncbi:MAG: TorF family putative porin [Lautropia sp.]